MFDVENADVGDHEVAPSQTLFESLIGGIGEIAQIEKSIIPALLQTSAYAAAVERWNPVRVPDEYRLARVDLRMRRQEVLRREFGALKYRCVLSEAALTARVGAPGVLVDQLRHLAEMATDPVVDLRLLPHDGRDAPAPNGYQMVYRRHETRPFMVVMFEVDQPRYVERHELVAVFVTMFDYLSSLALSNGETLERISEIADREPTRK